MSDTRLLLLDTNVVLQLVRGNATGEALDRAYGLRARPDRPLISIVTVGEMLAMAKRLNWGAKKVETLKLLASELVVVDIDNQRVLDNYAEIHAFAVTNGYMLGDNDIWIAATAAAAGAVLLTTDRDFDPLADILLTRIYFDPAVG
ncbi:MAG TPA: type II toxin-antitoxin system VapC family toxin [Kofleriaceae bacterium]|nr:type II toxin-antitoxin system VapC family toxin [Kofleriaceae bacterium]